MKQHGADYDPLSAIDEVRRRLGAPRVNISVLWTVVTQLASDLQYALAQLESQRQTLRAYQDRLIGLQGTDVVGGVGGSDSAAPSSETRWYVVDPLPLDD